MLSHWKSHADALARPVKEIIGVGGHQFLRGGAPVFYRLPCIM